jgi:hypothetical protein
MAVAIVPKSSGSVVPETSAPLDYDLHGLAGIRLLDASAGDAALVERQIGKLRGSLAREPEIIIRFVDRLATSSRMRYLGLDDAGFTEDGFFVFRGRYKSRIKVQIPFEQVGRKCEIICERGLPRVPLLIAIINLTVLKNGALPLHAAAFDHRGTGILATGWSKGGKTETLLGFMADGAAYVGDEWVYLSSDGKRLYGIPEPIRVWNWHLEHLPQYRARLAASDRARLRILGYAFRGMNWITANGARNRSPLFRTTGRLKNLVKTQLFTDVLPERLFGKEACRLSGNLDKVLFVTSHEGPEITVRPIDPQEVASRMVFSLQDEQMNFMSYYWKFRFAFPRSANELVECSRTLQHQILMRVLSGKEAYEVSHPYPVPIPALCEAIRTHCG